jgi:hypothetical protein
LVFLTWISFRMRLDVMYKNVCFHHKIKRKLLSLVCLFTCSMGYLINAMKSSYVLLNYWVHKSF